MTDRYEIWLQLLKNSRLQQFLTQGGKAAGIRAHKTVKFLHHPYKPHNLLRLQFSRILLLAYSSKLQKLLGCALTDPVKVFLHEVKHVSIVCNLRQTLDGFNVNSVGMGKGFFRWWRHFGGDTGEPVEATFRIDKCDVCVRRDHGRLFQVLQNLRHGSEIVAF